MLGGPRKERGGGGGGGGTYNRTQISVSNLNKVYRNADQTLLTSNSCLKQEGGL